MKQIRRCLMDRKPLSKPKLQNNGHKKTFYDDCHHLVLKLDVDDASHEYFDDPNDCEKNKKEEELINKNYYFYRK